MLSQHLKRNLYDDFPYAKELVALRNKIVHQRYVATEKEALEFMDFAKTIYNNAYKK